MCSLKVLLIVFIVDCSSQISCSHEVSEECGGSTDINDDGESDQMITNEVTNYDNRREVKEDSSPEQRRANFVVDEINFVRENNELEGTNTTEMSNYVNLTYIPYEINAHSIEYTTDPRIVEKRCALRFWSSDCVRDSLKLFRARLGSVDCKRGGTLVPIKKIEIHPYYVYGKPNFDVALLRLASPVEYSDSLRPIGISKINGKVLSAKFMTTYWPRIVLKGKTIPETAKERIKHNRMRVSTQKLIPVDKCNKIMKAINEHINESSLCLEPIVTHHSECMPDAGAPVVAEDGLWGITSGWVAPTCPTFAAPTIFTRISSISVRSWLDIQLLNI
ncbi:hypothetical protein HF086_006388 [Spodoptera exigua]|uniref:Peptidase S1 domain-containing protein n=1 Tax=Spodoptera exigua TaxID=7107 RepID=A0A922SNM9_SPOEX|nr:hypothetical protein HF086_006388 [Spodoptera exigua]